MGRDLTKSAHEGRHHEESIVVSNDNLIDRGWSKGTVAFPDLRKGSIGLCFANLIAHVGMGYADDFGPTFRSPDNAFASASGQLSYYQLMDRRGELTIVTDLDDLQQHVEAWNKPGDDDNPIGPGIVIGMEGADPVLSPNNLDLWWDKGLRIISLVHYGIGRYAHGTGSSGGLLDRGRELLRAMQAKGFILDTTHLAERAFWEALEVFDGPVIASHNNCRALVPGDRQFTDEQIKALADRDAVIGVALDNWMLNRELKEGKKDKGGASLEDVADHIDHICDVSGGSRVAAIGTDLDGGFGAEQSPREIDTIADLQKLASVLEDRGYDDGEIEDVFYRNWLRKLESAWKD
uniref:Peptidase M19 renal dipeptidase n=1 Tax=uncultured organism TaxID=155900 RepID=M1QAY8_9ZZZZ|nr:peptidase M19 renal dipeptidase [uncultured organism]